jgi:hypothetical protein
LFHSFQRKKLVGIAKNAGIFLRRPDHPFQAPPAMGENPKQTISETKIKADLPSER